MVDIHTHILPAIDDGSQDIGESLSMAEQAVSNGTDILVCTPHANQRGRFENYASKELEQLFQQLQQEVKNAGMPLQLLMGMEIFASMDMAGKIEKKELLPIAETNNYLVEFGFEEEPDYIQEILFGMLRQGVTPVLAHPERYFCVQEYPAFIFEWMKAGVLTQLNKGSFFGRFGRKEERTAYQLAEHNLVTCIASDAHGPTSRTTVLDDLFEQISRSFTEEMALTLLEWNPRRLIFGEKIKQNILPFSDRGWY